MFPRYYLQILPWVQHVPFQEGAEQLQAHGGGRQKGLGSPQLAWRECLGNAGWTLQPLSRNRTFPELSSSRETPRRGGGQTKTSRTRNCQVVTQAMQTDQRRTASLRRRWSRVQQEVREPCQLLEEEHSRQRSVLESVQRSWGRRMMGLFKQQAASAAGTEGGVRAQAGSRRGGRPQWGLWLLPAEASGLGMVLIMVSWDLSGCWMENRTSGVQVDTFLVGEMRFPACGRAQMKAHCLFDRH